MVLAMRHAPYRSTDLTALLDALEQDLFDAPVAELREAQRETGRAWETSCQEVRALLIEAVAANADNGPAATPIGAETAITRQ